MGKYMKKSKITGDIAVMDVSPSSIGVRTRAKTLALRTLSADHPDYCYLQLRSRRLHKPPPPPSVNPSSTCTHLNPNPIPTSTLPPRSLSVNNDHTDPCYSNNEGTEASFGDNSLDFEHRDRGTRESTPCSLIRTLDSIGTPGSTTRQRSMPATYQEGRNDQRIVPTQREIEEFFACAEQQQARLFIEKYNFDITNGLPLPGRYEWVEVTP
uniref:Cyclin-dependent kinase inhibitor n=1 Tax=Dimocarpus longan TaxID=128017 RepID=A0A8G0QY15_9ROSI|nr:cyclin-dependent kinase inhibitor 2 [Dimocarpus longan]